MIKREKPVGSGRKKGSVNKLTSELSSKLKEYGLDPIRGLAEILPTLDAKDQMTIHLGLMPYIYPKRASIQLTTEQEEKLRHMELMERIPQDHLKHLLKKAIKEGKQEIDLNEL